MVWICGKEKQQDMILNEFWIDKLEVSNEQFQTFVDAGGYQNAALWDGLIFQQDGKTLGWAQAVKSFVDQTGQRTNPLAKWSLSERARKLSGGWCQLV